MKRTIFTLIVSNFLTLGTGWLQAQTLSLDECMAYAVENSTIAGQKSIELDNRQADYQQSIAALFPNISGQVSGATNFGRSIDPATNTYTNITTFSNGYSLSASLTLFDGLQSINTLKAANVARKQGATDLSIAQDEVAINTLKSYMDVVYYTEAVAIAREQLEASQKTLALTQRQYQLGQKSSADVAEIESQVANYDYLLTTQENNRDLARIKLQEIMNYPQDSTLHIITDIPTTVQPTSSSQEDIIYYALQYNPRIVSAQLVCQYQQLQYNRAKGAFSPSLYLSGGYNTSYFTDFDNRYSYENFATQLNNNRGAYVQVTLSIPIFSGLNITNNKRRAKNAWRNAQLEQTATERSIESEVAQTYQEMLGYGKQYVQADKKVSAAQIAYDGAAKKFESGMISALDLQTAANTLLQAKSDRLQAQLQYFIKCRMVDYYNGQPLIK